MSGYYNRSQISIIQNSTSIQNVENLCKKNHVINEINSFSLIPETVIDNIAAENWSDRPEYYTFVSQWSDDSYTSIIKKKKKKNWQYDSDNFHRLPTKHRSPVWMIDFYSHACKLSRDHMLLKKNVVMVSIGVSSPTEKMHSNADEIFWCSRCVN